MSYYTREDSHQMREIASILRKNNIPYRFENGILGLQLRFDWSKGDVVCHEGTCHMPESYHFPWDGDDVTRDTPEGMASRIIAHYRGIKGEKLYRVCLTMDMTVNAEDEHTAISLAMANLEDRYFEVAEINPRKQWIDSHYDDAIAAAQTLDDYNTNIAHIKFCKDVTIFIRHWENNDDDIGVAAPRHGDKYDRKTGIAVAYAKAMGEAVPDYI